MSKTSRRRNLQDAHESMRHIAAALRRAEAIWDEELHGQVVRSSSTDGAGTGGKGGHSDPTATVATRDGKARDDERNVERLLAGIAKSLRTVETTLTYWTSDIPAKAEELAKLERDAQPGCEIVGSVMGPSGLPHWEPVLRTSDLGGILPRPYAMGTWAYRFTIREGRLPTQAERVTHAKGERVMVKA